MTITAIDLKVKGDYQTQTDKDIKHRQTERQTQTDRQTDRQTETDKHMERKNKNNQWG